MLDTTLMVCSAVFIAANVATLRLMRFARDCDRCQADMDVVEAAERIVREAARA
jgi:hypothetical protein